MSTRASVVSSTTSATMCEEIEITQLISLVENNPVIWNKNLANYKCKVTRDCAWKNVCKGLIEGYEDMDDDVKTELYKEITKKWRSIKDNFIKCVKKMKDLDPLSSRRATRYHHYEHLLFLKRVVTPAPGVGGGVELGLVKEECEDQESPPPSPAREEVRARRRRLTPVQARVALSRRVKQRENRHVWFVRGLLPTLDSFSELQTLRFQRAVLDLVAQIKYGDTLDAS